MPTRLPGWGIYEDDYGEQDLTRLECRPLTPAARKQARRDLDRLAREANRLHRQIAEEANRRADLLLERVEMES